MSESIVAGKTVTYRTKSEHFKEWRGIVKIVQGNIAIVEWLNAAGKNNKDKTKPELVTNLVEVSEEQETP